MHDFEAKKILNEQFYLNLEEIFCWNENAEFIRLDRKRAKRLYKPKFYELQHWSTFVAIIFLLVFFTLTQTTLYEYLISILVKEIAYCYIAGKHFSKN